MKKNNKGITLVSLVITIVILLILAGVAIATLTQTGLFENTKQAKNAMENAQIEENEILVGYENKVNEIVGGVNGSRDNASESEALRKQKTMSEKEHFTGEYYLDNKPIYAKTIYIESLPNKQQLKYEYNINDVDEIWLDQSKCYWINKNGERGPLPHVSPSQEWSIELVILDNKYIRLSSGVDSRNYSGYITFNYTKTTD